MQIKAILLAATMVFPTAAVAQLPDGQLVTPEVAPPSITGPGAKTPAANQPLVNVLTPNFVALAASSSQLAADAGRLAATQAGSDEIRALANQLTEDHLALLEAVLRASGELTGATPGNEPSERDLLIDGHRQQLLQLSSQRGSDFDAGFINVQLQVHRQMDQLFEAYATTGDEEDLRLLASEARPMIAKYRERLEQMAPTSG